MSLTALFGGGSKPKPAVAPPAPTQASVQPQTEAATTAALLAAQGSGFSNTIKSTNDDTVLTPTAKLLGGTYGSV